MLHILFLGKHILYWNFDTLDNLVLMQGNQQMDFDALVPRQVFPCVLGPQILILNYLSEKITVPLFLDKNMPHQITLMFKELQMFIIQHLL